MKIGVLALQGNFAVHQRALTQRGFQTVLVKTPSHLNAIDALVLPGGESTTMRYLLEKHELYCLLSQRVEAGLPVFATCAGIILLAQMGQLAVEVQRNAYGPQLASFATNLSVKCPEDGSVRTLEAYFIRAPKIIRWDSQQVVVLASHQTLPVIIRQKHILAATCHPEMASDPWLYDYFCQVIAAH